MKLTLRQRFQNAARAFGVTVSESLTPVSSAWSTLQRAIGDWLTGAWQQATDDPNQEDVRDALGVALVYACVRAIATDIAKMTPGVRRLSPTTKVWERATHQVFDRLITRPNHFQTWFQFMTSWLTCRNIAGRVYVLKLYGANGLIQELVVLDPTRVETLVAYDTGAVFYRVHYEPLARVAEEIVVADADMIYDRYMPLGHPLLGTSPLDRALSGANARGGIMDQAGDMASHASVPPGVLTTPEGLTEEQLSALADKWRQIPRGRIAVLDAAYKFEPLSSKYVDSQAAEIADLAAVDICAAFGVPGWKVGIGVRPVADVEALQITYYQDCLQWQVEEIEQCLDAGLGVPADVYIELDPCAIFKMDSKGRAEVHKMLVAGGIMSPNEARQVWDLPPVKGGETPYLQQQNYSLSALAARDSAAPAPSTSAPTPGGGSSGQAPEPGNTDHPTAGRNGSVLLPWAGVWRADGEYPVGCFTTHKGSLWARVWRPGAVLGGTTDTHRPYDEGEEIGAEPGTEAGRIYWALSVKRGEAPTENAP